MRLRLAAWIAPLLGVLVVVAPAPYTPLGAQQPQASPTHVPTVRPVAPASTPDSERREVGAAGTADSFPRVLYVALPRTYADSAQKQYPVVYVLDGDAYFGAASDAQRILAIGREVPEAIVVGVGHGRPYMGTLPFRNRNFTPTPYTSAPGSGQAAGFLAYLEREVVPLVDSVYRTVQDDRTLVGVSSGGLFAAYVLYERPALFARIVMISPDARRAYLLPRDTVFAATRRPLPAVVYLSIGGAELTQPLGIAATAFADALAARRYNRLRLTVDTLTDETHFSTIVPAISRGLKVVLRARP